ncbi:hypothetical protein L204_100654 [Cryptococcus depauperatus]
MPLCLMITTWTFFSWIPWIAPIIGFMLFGFECYIILAAIFNYVVNNYGHYPASALDGVVFVRNIASVVLCRWTALMSDQPFMQVSAIFPLFSNDMFKGMGNQWTLFLLTMALFLMASIPFYLFYRGKAVRDKSLYHATHCNDD